MKTPKDWKSILGIIGVVLAVAIPLAPMAGITFDWGFWVLVVVGAVLGFTIKKFDMKYAVASLLLFAIVGIFALIPQAGSLLSDVLKNLAVLSGAIFGIPALRFVLSRITNKKI